MTPKALSREVWVKIEGIKYKTPEYNVIRYTGSSWSVRDKNLLTKENAHESTK